MAVPPELRPPDGADEAAAWGHVPVLPAEVPAWCPTKPGAVIVDCTLGAAGHSLRLLMADATRRLVALDADPGALELARRRLEPVADRVTLRRASFSALGAVLDELGIAEADYLLADIGLSSRQLDDPARGFSFAGDAPLDMRFGPDRKRTAADLVNGLDERELAELIARGGEDPFAGRIARRIVEARSRAALTSAAVLADVVRSAYPSAVRARSRVDPATRTFQALRIAVNDEAGELDALLAAGPGRLAVGGRMAVISFHSLEDRAVKTAFRERAEPADTLDRVTGARRPPRPGERAWRVLTRKPVEAGPAEVAANPRSRSAKLRVLERWA